MYNVTMFFQNKTFSYNNFRISKIAFIELIYIEYI